MSTNQKKIKAWVVIFYGIEEKFRFVDICGSKTAALNYLHANTDAWLQEKFRGKIVPCTITYSFPASGGKPGTILKNKKNKLKWSTKSKKK